jgi:hypothetical protein
MSVGVVDQAQVASGADEGLVDRAVADLLEAADLVVGVAAEEEREQCALVGGRVRMASRTSWTWSSVEN